MHALGMALAAGYAHASCAVEPCVIDFHQAWIQTVSEFLL